MLNTKMLLMQKLFEDFEQEGIEYVHFKSNTHLDDSFLGYGDFDVLINPKHLSDAEKIILAHKGKRYNSFYYGRYPGVDNWLLYDNGTGEIKHLHLHCQLASGKSQIKDYIIPWSRVILKNRIKDEKWNIYICDPDLEILLLAVRTVIKADCTDILNALAGRYRMHRDLQEEWNALHKMISQSGVEGYLRLLFEEKAEHELADIISKNTIDSKDFLSLMRLVRRELKYDRRISGLKATVQSNHQKISMKGFRFAKRHFNSCRLIKKTGMTSGTIIAFVGVDGAGKSTMTKEITKWLGRKIECTRFYMGEGDGKTTIFVSAMKRAGLIASNIRPGKKEKTPDLKDQLLSADPEKQQKDVHRNKAYLRYLKKYVRACMILSVEKKNHKNLRRMYRYRLNGGISILDRYPQTELCGRNDGPKIAGLLEEYRNKQVHRLIREEQRYLSIVKRIKPDLVIRLNIPVDVSMARKPEQEDPEVFQKKIDDLMEITYQNANIVDIDASQPYEQELLEVKQLIWDSI